MANVYVDFSPETDKKFRRSRESCQMLYDDLGVVVESVTGIAYRDKVDFIHSTKLNLFWTPCEAKHLIEHDVKLSIEDHLAESVASAINGLDGYCAKTD